MKDRPHISVVIPVYGCEKCLVKLYERLTSTLEAINPNFEVVFVDDASPDHAWQTIVKLTEKDERVKGIRLSTNFGQHYALTAGIDHVQGDWTVVMDCDLQDRPEDISILYGEATKGYDVVFGRRVKRKDLFLKRMSSKLFYKALEFFTDSQYDESIANFSIVSKKVVDNFRHLREKNRSYPMFVRWLGFRSTAIDINHASRYEGKSTYSLKKMIKLAVNIIVSQSNKALRISIQLGFGIALISLLFGLYLIFKYLFLGQSVQGWTSMMVSMYFLAGLLLVNMGVIGLYLGKVFDEVKNRPLYVISEVKGSLPKIQ